MSIRTPTRKTLRNKAELLRILGHPTRIAIVQKLAKGPECVTDIQELLDVPQANISQHLTVLRSHQIVDFYEDGKLRCYYLTRPNIATLIEDLLASDFPVVERSAAEVRAASGKRIENGACLDSRAHWEEVYSTKAVDDVGWFKPSFDVSLRLIEEVSPARTSRIIDVGGGASLFVDGLLARDYQHVSVLDIAVSGLEQAQQRIGSSDSLADRASRVNWIVGDICHATGLGPFDVWHDRAVFHFLTDADDRKRYAAVARKAIPVGGHAIIAAFSPTGPQRCSGLTTCRYSASELAAELGPGFKLVKEVPELHVTPRGKKQSFVYALLRRVKASRSTPS
jgi:DNA-binding transcriptional ArsR family regulator